MKKIHYKLRLQGTPWGKGSIGARALQELLDVVVDCAERGLRLAVQGESVKKGKLPAWLGRSLDFVVTGLKAGSTIVQLEAPILGETAADQIRQQDLWVETPVENDTALSLMSRSIQNVTAGDLENPYCDVGILEGLLKFKPYLASYAKDLEFACRERPKENFRIGTPELQKVEAVRKKTPQPTAFVVSGQFDSIKHSSRRFQLMLSNGQILPGTVDLEYLGVEDMRSLWGKNVTVKGMVHFFPSGRPRLIEAQVLKPMESGEEVFDKLPEPDIHRTLFEPPSKTSVKSPLQEAWEKWPGDESIGDILAALGKG